MIERDHLVHGMKILCNVSEALGLEKGRLYTISATRLSSHSWEPVLIMLKEVPHHWFEVKNFELASWIDQDNLYLFAPGGFYIQSHFPMNLLKKLIKRTVKEMEEEDDTSN
jgi:hypothetical protein